MLFGFLCAFVLAGVLLAQRSRTAPGAFAMAWSGNATSTEKIVAAVLLVACVAPFFPLIPWLDGPSPTYFADAVAHAHVARDIAERGLPHAPTTQIGMRGCCTGGGGGMKSHGFTV